ncbi:eL43 family ribosomal protein [Halorussus halophilus]|uniref:hypothetical protein n=1 Tax=Halorussus halophilus TaxID=2650975 RepID=UPI0013016AB3|nr:hypothetical protein [Halorussus halophilus]
MSVTGLCQICEQREAKHSCPNCGTLACERHWNEETDLCEQCASTIQGGQRPQTDQPTQPDLDDEDVLR